MQEIQFSYKDQILNTACMLATVYRELFLYGFNMALNNELQYLKDVFEDGDEWPGDVALLEALDDENVKMILSAMYDIEEYGQSLMNLNNISDEQVDENLEEGNGSEYIALGEVAAEADYSHWMYEAMGYIHLSTFNLMSLCYMISHGVNEVPDELCGDLAFPTDETMALLDTDDQNVKLLSELALKLNEAGNELCERL